MATSKVTRSWAEQLLDFDDPAPKDFDPEDNAGHPEAGEASSSSGEDLDAMAAREHYADVGKSKLRKPEGISLGPRYNGSSVSRDALLDGDSDDDPFEIRGEQGGPDNVDYADPNDDLELEDGADDEIANNNTFESRDEAKFEGYAFTGSKDRRQGQVDDGGDNIVEDLEDGEEDLDMESSLEEAKSVRNAYEQENGDSGAFDMVEAPMDSDSSDSSVSDNHNEPIADDRAALRKMMAEEQRTVAASLNKAAKADITKGRAIRDQRTTFDTLLNTRIKLQKALIATNSMSASATAPSDHSSTIQAAETAALNLWNTISTLRSSLQTPNPKKSSSSATQSNPSSDLWAEMESNEKISVPNRRANLTKWSQKTNPTLALPRANNFSQTPGQQPLTSMLDQHLSGINGEKLVAKTRIPRSCAPIQASSRTIASDVSIYDDADFYTLLLRGLVDQRMAVSNSTNMTAGLPALPNRRELKVKKPVDTKASKGRKMRYTMHEKLQNFMAPDDRGTWGERQRDELFGGLLGRKVKLGEDEEGVDGEDGDGEGSEMDGEVEVEGLRLFG